MGVLLVVVVIAALLTVLAARRFPHVTVAVFTALGMVAAIVSKILRGKDNDAALFFGGVLLLVAYVAMLLAAISVLIATMRERYPPDSVETDTESPHDHMV